MFILNENWYTWYIAGANSKSRLRYLKFRYQNPFLGEIGLKISNLSVCSNGISRMLIPNPDLHFWNSYPKIHFLAKLASKFQNCLFCLKSGSHGISRMLIPKPDLDFWNFDPKSHFWANLGPKSRSCVFWLKIGTHGIWRMLILVTILIFWISNRNFLFGQIWVKKVKVDCFDWKFANMISREFWFLF